MGRKAAQRDQTNHSVFFLHKRRLLSSALGVPINNYPLHCSGQVLLCQMGCHVAVNTFML